MGVYDVIVVGAGPSGSVCAEILAKNGLKTLVIDKKRKGWEKPCGGAMEEHFFEEFGIPKMGARTKGIKAYKGEHSEEAVIKYRTFVRSEFDEYLSRKAEDSGAEVILETECKAIESHSKSVRIKTSRGIFSSSILVGADGVNSLVRKHLKEDLEKKEFAFSATQWMKGSHRFEYLEMFLDKELAPAGYIWFFPRAKDIASVGIVSRTAKQLNKSLDSFIRSNKYRFRGLRKYGRVQNALIPTEPTDFAYSDGCLLVGDAAGLVAPILYGGIHTAIKSGRFAAQQIIKAFNKNSTQPLEDYSNRLIGEMGESYNIPRIYWDKIKNNMPVRYAYLFEKLILKPWTVNHVRKYFNIIKLMAKEENL